MDNFIITRTKENQKLHVKYTLFYRLSRCLGTEKITAFFCLCLLVLYSASSVFAQDNQENEWTLGPAANGVEFYYAVDNCNGENVIYLKLTNTNAHPVIVTWKDEIWLEGNQAPNEVSAAKTMTIPGNQAISQLCGSQPDPLLAISLNELTSSPPSLHAFTFHDVEVTTLN